MAVELLVTAGPHAGKSFAFAEHATFLVGRSPRAHFSLPAKDPYVSRLHFLVEVNPPLARLRDMGSRNGTVVNGAKVLEADLADGDEIVLGETTLAVKMAGKPATPEELPTRTLAGPPPTPLRSATGGPPAITGGGVTHTLPPAGGGPAAGGGTLSHEPRTLAVPGYELVKELGRGGMGVVYQARHKDTGELLAVKTILPAASPGPTAVAKFLRETEVVRRLDHPHVVRYRDAGGGDGGMPLWFAMEYVAGEDAGRIAHREGRLDVRRAVGWVLQLLDALGYAHRQGFVHRDVKPGNMLVGRGPGGAEHVKLADFGLARAYEASSFSGLTLTGAAGGTVPFMPPEQVLDLRSARPPADQYAAAATLYRLLAGTYPHPQEERVERMFRRILEDDPTPIRDHRPDLPAPLAAAVHRALAREAGGRFPDVAAFAAAIRPFAGG